MPINKLHFTELRNNEYFQFHTETKELIETTNPAALKILNLFEDEYKPRYVIVDTSIQKIKKNSITEKRGQKDTARDGSFRVSNTIVKSTLSHSTP